MDTSVMQVYQDFIWQEANADIARRLYNSPVTRLGGGTDRVKELKLKFEKTAWFTDERIRRMKDALSSMNREIGGLSPRVSSSISRIDSGVVEAAHQSVVMGGPAYVLNKAVTAERVAHFSTEDGTGLVPYFFMADYDIVQAELTNIRTPLMGQLGNLISIPVPKGFEHSPVSVLPLPGKEWYSDVEDSIRDNYTPMFKVLDGYSRTLFEERLEHILSIIRGAYLNASTLSEWAARILAKLFNIEGDLGIPILFTSNKEVRRLMAQGLEFLLKRKNRDTFLRVHEEITDYIVAAGYIPGAGRRNRTYVPFFYECQGEDCHKSRIELSYTPSGSQATLSGKCPVCGQKVEAEVSQTNPDLSSVAEFISPRVDSRQIAVDTILPITVHVGGAGETAYYAQVIPAAEEMGVPFPLFIKYPRVYFNTPWNEDLAKTLKDNDCPVLHSPSMFRISGKINRFRGKNQFEKMNAKLVEFVKLLIEMHESLNRKHDMLDENDSDAQMMRLDIERYLSWVYGQYTDGKLGQESTWSWVEWALNSSLADLFGPYQRAYVREMKNGATLFVNFFV